MTGDEDLHEMPASAPARPNQVHAVSRPGSAVPARASEARARDPFGVRLRANLLQSIIQARMVLADLRLPLSTRISMARLELRRARLMLKVCRDSLGPSYAARAARLKLCAGALKVLDGEPRRVPVGLAFTPGLPAQEEERRIAELAGLLRRCEVDAVSLAPGLIDAVGAAQALARARRQSLSRAGPALATREPELCRRWLKALRRQAVLARLLSAEWPEDAGPSPQQISAQSEDLSRYLQLDALCRQAPVRKSKAAGPDAVPEAVLVERKAVWRRLRSRQRLLFEKAGRG